MKLRVRIALVAAALAALSIAPRPAGAAEPTPHGSRTGLGLILGEPTGLSLKQGLGGAIAVDLAVGWSFRGGGALDVHADGLVHPFQLLREGQGRLVAYFGLGPRIVARHDVAFAARIPVGLSALFDRSSLEFFVELVPELVLYPGTDVILEGGIGLRIYF